MSTNPYLKTLRRIPDDIVLSMATREIEPSSPCKCLCGWAMREAIARVVGVDASAYTTWHNPMFECEARFGGTHDEWRGLFLGICSDQHPEEVEAAFVTRVMEAAGVA